MLLGWSVAGLSKNARPVLSSTRDDLKTNKAVASLDLGSPIAFVSRILYSRRLTSPAAAGEPVRFRACASGRTGPGVRDCDCTGPEQWTLEQCRCAPQKHGSSLKQSCCTEISYFFFLEAKTRERNSKDASEHTSPPRSVGQHLNLLGLDRTFNTLV
jgi:hypothetical protein